MGGTGKQNPAGRERGADTRERLLDAAVEVFGRLGYDGAGTRALAAAAGANLAAIPYHFGSKEGLYLATARHVAARIGESLAPLIERAGRALQDLREPQPADAAALLGSLLGDFAALMMAPEADRWAAFILREQMAPTRAFGVLYDGFMVRMVAMVMRLLTLCGGPSGRHASGPDMRLRAFALLGQAMAFRVGRAAVMRTLGWEAVGPAELEAVRAAVRAGVAAAVAPERTSSGGGA